jgi:hypothetical protein
VDTPLLLDPAHAEVRVEFGMARAEVALEFANRATAELWAAIGDTLDEAREHPEVFVSPELELKPQEHLEFSVRAAAADLAVRLGISEASVRSHDAQVHTLRARMPRLWAEFREGRILPANARAAADLAFSLPDDADVLTRFDSELAGPAERLAPARFRARARALRDRLCSDTLADRAAAARASRGVWLDDDVDGMSWLSLRLPAASAHRAYAGIDAAARSLHSVDGETRTLAQLRADVAADLLAGEGSTGRVGVSVAVTVPVMTLLGRSEEPGTLDGYGPIDAQTARELAGHAPSFTRLLVHPVSSAILDVDRTTYRVPADLKKWLAIRDRTCVFPGCGRPASASDLDHTHAWQHGGPTRANNLAHLCRHHHRLKHQTRWRLEQSADQKLRWTSPTGAVRDSDPPPF